MLSWVVGGVALFYIVCIVVVYFSVRGAQDDPDDN